MLKKKIWPVFKELYNFLPKNLSISSQKYRFGIRDPRSGIWDPEKKPIPGPGFGSRGQKGTGSRIPDPDPQHCILESLNMIPVPVPFVKYF
jgi:hypothetical protein